MSIKLTEVDSRDGLEFLVLTGDLRGFSRNYNRNPTIYKEFLRRFYTFTSSCIESAGGDLVKFTGDGFLALWPLHDSDFRKNSKICEIVEVTAFSLSGMIKISELDLEIESETFLRQGITIEENATEVEYGSPESNFEYDYLGTMINLSFFIPKIPEVWPYMAVHKDFIELKNMYDDHLDYGAYTSKKITEEKLGEKFEGYDEVDEIFTLELDSEAPVNEILKNHTNENYSKNELKKLTRNLVSGSSDLGELLPDNSEIQFQKKLLDLSLNAPDWFRNSYVVYLKFLKELTKNVDEIQEIQSQQIETEN